MGSSPEIEHFDVSEYDYNFMQGNFGKRKKTSKKNQIYGCFASDSDDEIDIPKNKKRDFTAPISFVSGGIKGEEKKISSEDVDKYSEDDLDIKEFVKQNLSSDEEEISLVPEKPKFTKPTMRAKNSIRQKVTQPNSNTFGAWQNQIKGIGLKLLEKMGYQHGKGLGKDGQGILTPIEVVQRVGKGSVGYAGPEHAKAPKRGNEAHSEDEAKSQNVPDDGPRYKKKTDKVSIDDKKRNHKVNYMTAAEILKNSGLEGANQRKKGIFLANSEILKAKVIDMTQKDKKVYQNYDQALGIKRLQETTPESICEIKNPSGSFDVPVLKHNMNLILNQFEGELRKKDRDMRFEEEQIEALNQESINLKSIIQDQTLEIASLHSTLEVINEFEEFLNKLDQDNLEIDKCTEWFSAFKDKASDVPELPCLLASVAKPLLDLSFKAWKPLQQPLFGLNLFKEWQGALDDDKAFEVILETIWLPIVRREIQTVWNPKNPDGLLRLLESWACLLTDRILRLHILSMTIFPVLQSTLDSWDPLTDVIPVHTWLHPWLPWFLPSGVDPTCPGSTLPSGFLNQMPMLHEIVRHKFAISLKNWHPNDSSALAILLPWNNVWSNSEMTIFLHKHIIPKLVNSLSQFQINPTNQNIEPWKWIVRWLPLITPTVFINLVERYFIPKWNSVLTIWLNQAVKNKSLGSEELTGKTFAEIGAWYSGWKNQFPESVHDHPVIKNLFMNSLNMMEHAMKGLPVQDPTVSSQRGASYPGLTNKSNVSNAKNSFYKHAVESAMSGYKASAYKVHANVREQVEEEAQNQGYVFFPMHNRYHEDKQVYKLEKINVFFDRNVPFYFSSSDNQWHPVSAKELFEIARV